MSDPEPSSVPSSDPEPSSDPAPSSDPEPVYVRNPKAPSCVSDEDASKSLTELRTKYPWPSIYWFKGNWAE